MKRIGIIGSGVVAKSLASGLVKHGYDVMISSRDKKKHENLGRETKAKTGTFEEASAYGDLVILAVRGDAAEDCAKSLAGHLKGKTVIDTTNPISEKPPVNGVLRFFTSLEESLMERLQRAVPGAHFVKAFNSIGSAFMIDPSFGSKPSMFICGNNPDARNDIAGLLKKVGWDVEDMGSAEAARAIEPLCMLWCIPGLKDNEWSHAFRLLKK